MGVKTKEPLTEEVKEQSVFDVLSAINVNDKVEQKNKLTYLSWAFAWGELLKKYPNSTYTIYENQLGYNYFTDGKTCWVKTGVTVEDKELIEYLPVMDFRNASITADKVTSFEVNKTIQRSLTKAIARHGLGLYIYAGEDLPEGEEYTKQNDSVKPKVPEKKTVSTKAKLIKGDNPQYTNVVEKLKSKSITLKQVVDAYDINTELLTELTELTELTK